jgi:hypothetical protein
MRLQGLQLRGLSVPAGEHQLDFDAGFTSVETRSLADAHGLSSLLCALLYPDRELPRLASWASMEDARVVVALAVRGESHLLVADSRHQRLQLARREAGSQAFNALSSEPAEIAEFFREFCCSDQRDFQALHTLGVSESPPASASAFGQEDDTLRTEAGSMPLVGPARRAQLEISLARARQALEARSALMARAEPLRRARAELTLAEESVARASAELEAQAELSIVAEGLEDRIEAFHKAVEQRDAERHEMEESRRTLLAERVQLRAAPARARTPSVLGALLIAAGAATTVWLHAAGALIGLFGALLAGVAQLRAHRARRALGRVEAVLSALRLRERTCEQRFEAETAPLREAMARLELSEVHELRAAIDAHGELAKQVEELAARAVEARAAFTPPAALELERLERDLSEPDPAPLVAQFEADLRGADAEHSAPAAAAGPARSCFDPDELVAAAGRGAGASDEDVRGRLAASLPLYLRALTDAAYTHARRRPVEGWVLRGPERERVTFAEVEPEMQWRVSLAFQFALLERLGAQRRLPLIIGPDLFPMRPAETRALVRALGRLSSVIQVIRIGPPDPAWAAQARRTLQLDA